MTACDPREIPTVEQLGAGEYIGNYTVKKDGDLTYEKQNVIFKTTIDADKKHVTLIMNKVKFATLMPVTLTIVANNVACKTEEDSYVATTDVITPTVDDVPMEKYKLHNLNIRFTDDKLYVSFFCKENVVDFEGER